ncbi:MAG: EamA family transporter [Candidatus Bipolaricaulota bacterium]
MLIGILLSLGAALCGSVGYVAIKQGLQTADYKVFILLSTLIGVVISGPLLWIFGCGLAGLNLKAVLPFLITGGLGGGLLARISLTKATHQIGASRTHALTSVSPLVTAILGITLLDEVVNAQLAFGTAIVIVGACFLSYLVYRGNSTNTPREKTTSPLLGLGLASYGMIMFGLHPILRVIGVELGATPLQGAFIRFLTAFVGYLIYMLIARPGIKVELNLQVNPYVIAGIAWALAPILSIFAIQYVSPTVYASLTRVGPLFTVILTYFFLKGIEKTNWKIGVNAFLIVIGAVLVSTA